jgi:hypothetical protein
MGRLSTFTAEIAETICRRLAEGEPLRAICRDEGMPPESTVRQWALDDVDGFAARYAHARELGIEAMAEQCIEIADDSGSDFSAGDDGPAFNAEHVQRSKLRVDTRKWLLAKMAPKKYGDRIDVGNADGKPFEVKDTGEAATRIATLLATAQQRKGLADLL